MRRLACLCAFILLVLRPAAAFGQCPLEMPRRPVEDLFGSDVVYPQERGEVQLEAAPSHRVGLTAIETAWEYGLTDALQIDGSWEGPRWTAADEAPRVVALGAKYAWMCVGGSPVWHASASFAVEFTILGNPEIVPNLIIGRDLPAMHGHLFTSLARAIPATHAPDDASTIWNTGMFVKVASVRPTVEFTVTRQLGSTINQIVPGLLWHSPEAWEIGVGVALPISGISGTEWRAHVVFEFGGEGR